MSHVKWRKARAMESPENFIRLSRMIRIGRPGRSRGAGEDCARLSERATLPVWTDVFMDSKISRQFCQVWSIFILFCGLVSFLSKRSVCDNVEQLMIEGTKLGKCTLRHSFGSTESFGCRQINSVVDWASFWLMQRKKIDFSGSKLNVYKYDLFIMHFDAIVYKGLFFKRWNNRFSRFNTQFWVGLPALHICVQICTQL